VEEVLLYALPTYPSTLSADSLFIVIGVPIVVGVRIAVGVLIAVGFLFVCGVPSVVGAGWVYEV
jgi:hypothetical protein